MKTYYRVNEINKKNLLRLWRNGQAIWKIGSKILICITFFCFAVCVSIYGSLTAIVSGLEQSSAVSIEFIAVMLAALFALIAGAFIRYFFQKIHFKAMDPYYKLTNEYIFLKADKMIIASHNILSKEVGSVDEYSLPYDKIKEIQMNSFYRQLTIIGQIDKVYYTDYSAGIGRNLPSEKDGKIRLLLYYDNEEELLEELAARSRVQIKRCFAV